MEMRRVFLLFVVLMTFAGLFGCGEDELPRTRVANETDEEVNISFKQGNDPTMNINGTQPGGTSAFREIQEGHTLVAGLPDKDSMAFTAERGTDYTVIVRTNNSKIEVSGQ
jgi:predicted small lipoprotein YifL